MTVVENGTAMPEALSHAADHSGSSRLRATNTFLAVVILVMLIQIAWQQMRISGLKADLEQSRRELTTRVEEMATERLRSHREEMVGAVAFVDDLYRSPDGLQRPDGLYIADAKRVDAEAIGTWVLDVYLQSRIAGKSDAEARQSIAAAIKGSDEWRRKHPGQ
jgi:hypothetical protein